MVALILCAAADAIACKCVPPSLGTAAARAKVALVGTITEVIETKHCNPKRPNRWCGSTFEYKVTVEGVWKGSVDTTTVTIDSGSGTGDCSRGRLGKVVGQRWLILADDELRIRLCGGTRRATTAVIATMTKRFGAPKVP